MRIDKRITPFCPFEKTSGKSSPYKKIHAKRIKDKNYLFLLKTIFFDKENSQSHNIDEAVHLAKSVKEPEERDEMLQDIAISITKKGDLEKARQIISQIQNVETRERSLFCMMQTLSLMGELQCAEEVTIALKDPKMRKKAYTYMIHTLLDETDLQEAIEFTDRIREETDKIFTARIILEYAISRRDRKLVKKIREHFQLS